MTITKKQNKMNGLDKTLLFIAILDTLFVAAMIVIFCIFQSVPDTLIISVFGATFGECGCCSYIWKHKRTTTNGSSDNSDNNFDLSDNSMFTGGKE